MEQDVIDLLKELVAIDSQNPSLVPGAAGESTIAGHVADWAEAAGLAAEIVEATPGRPSVLVRSRGRGHRHRADRAHRGDRAPGQRADRVQRDRGGGPRLAAAPRRRRDHEDRARPDGPG
jgi:acetylornithine deacetylase/succinyl-diaminopimelate desuccinylase-like protein